MKARAKTTPLNGCQFDLVSLKRQCDDHAQTARILVRTTDHGALSANKYLLLTRIESSNDYL